MDYGALQVLLLSALQKALADQQELRDAQGSMQLSVMGRIQELSEAVRRLQAGLASGSSGAGEGPLARVPSATSAGSLQSEDSLAQLVDAGDVEMASGGEEEAVVEAAGDFAGLSDEEAAQLLMDRLQEQPGTRKQWQPRRRCRPPPGV